MGYLQFLLLFHRHLRGAAAVSHPSPALSSSTLPPLLGHSTTAPLKASSPPPASTAAPAAPLPTLQVAVPPWRSPSLRSCMHDTAAHWVSRRRRRWWRREGVGGKMQATRTSVSTEEASTSRADALVWVRSSNTGDACRRGVLLPLSCNRSTKQHCGVMGPSWWGDVRSALLCTRRYHSDLSSSDRATETKTEGRRAAPSPLGDLLRRLDAASAAAAIHPAAGVCGNSTLAASAASQAPGNVGGAPSSTAAYVPLLFRSDFVRTAGQRREVALQRPAASSVMQEDGESSALSGEKARRAVCDGGGGANGGKSAPRDRSSVSRSSLEHGEAVEEPEGAGWACLAAAAAPSRTAPQVEGDESSFFTRSEEEAEEVLNEDEEMNDFLVDDVHRLPSAETNMHPAEPLPSSSSPPPLLRRSRRLILDPIQWLAELPDAPLMDPELLYSNTKVRDALRDAIDAAAATATGAYTASFDTHSSAEDEEMANVLAVPPSQLQGDTTIDSPEVKDGEKLNFAPLEDDNEAALLTDLLEDVPKERSRTRPNVVASTAVDEGTSPVTPAAAESDVLVYNVFTRRVAKANAPSIRLLALLGIGVDVDTRQLRLTDPEALTHLTSELRARRVSWPSLWTRGPLFRQLERLLCDETVTDPVAKVSGLLRLHYRTSSWQRQQPGVVVGEGDGDPNADPAEQQNDAQLQQGQEQQMAESVDDKLLTLQDLNDEQQAVVQLVLQGHHTYIGGGAGTGKSVLLRVLKQQLVREGLAVAVTGTTGISGAQIGGCTLHHCLGINVSGEFTRRKELASYDVIIIDEVSMLSRELFESLEVHLRRANNAHLPFGGVQIILCGDFLQLGAIGARPLIASPLFRRYFVHLKLHTVVRQNANMHFAAQLLQLRRGRVPRDLGTSVQLTASTRQVEMAQHAAAQLQERQRRQLQAVDASLAVTSPGEEGGQEKGSDSSVPAFVSGAVNLLPTNREVQETNTHQLAQLPGELVTYPAQFLPPALVGSWSPTYLLRVEDPEKLQRTAVYREIMRFLSSFYTMGQRATTTPAPAGTVSFSDGDWLLNAGLRERSVVLYPLFVDALALRVRLPPTMDREEARQFLLHVGELDKHLGTVSLGVRVSDIVGHGDGMHTEQDDYTLAQYAARATLAQTLQLKVGARVMLRTNLGPGLVNGSLGTVIGFRKLVLEELPRYLVGNAQREAAVAQYRDFLNYEQGFQTAMVPVVDFQGRHVPIPPITQYVGGLANTHFYSVGVVALPLSLAYAFTVHKVQGLTLVGRVHLELSRMWPCEHLLYVAMSRVRNPEQLSVSAFHPRLVRVDSNCLLFDDSLPAVSGAKVAPYMFAATWKRAPSQRKKVLLRKQLEDYVKRRRSKLIGEAKRGNRQAEIQLIEEAILKRRARAAVRMKTKEGIKEGSS